NLIGLLLAIPLFAHQYGVTCQKCHTVIPHLNDFGAHFLASGDRIPGVQPGPAMPLSSKANLLGSNENQGAGIDGAGLPKDIVDEVELFTAGALGTRGSYFIEQYVVDGGEHGLLRDAWVNDRINPWVAKIPLYAQFGMYTLPLPVDPETFRESYQDYAVYVQQVGNNPFDFFTPKFGLHLTAGDTLHGLAVQLFTGPGHDRQSGLETTGEDFMENVSDAVGPVTFTYYSYTGERPDVADLLDRFVRRGYGVVFNQGRWEFDNVLQTGYDSSYNGVGYASSGGFSQLRYTWAPRWFALARYDGTDDPNNGFQRDTVLLLGYGPSHNSRVTLEDVVEHATNTINLQFTIGY
ncbi:MAG TPA: hypothetical protein VF741_05545, partial [Candidatus Aquilonibacter sp.]